MHTAMPLTVLATALACSLATAPAHARARTFVASYGNDSNPCTFGSPCKTFQQAVTLVDAGGEVTAIDSAGFGPITINKGVTITSPAGVEAGIVPVATGNGITINAGPNDAVILRGLTLNGSDGAYYGIVFNSGGSLTVTDCVVQQFVNAGGFPPTGIGILIQPTSGTVNFTITNTIAVSNGGVGIAYSPLSGGATTTGVIDHVVANSNLAGILAFTQTPAGGTAVIAISNSVANSNVSTGVNIGNGLGTMTVTIDNVSAIGNNVGIAATTNATALLGRSVITGNNVGVSNATMSNTFYTYGNNQINLNNTDINPSLNTAFTPR